MRILTVLDSYPPDLNGGAYFTHRLAHGLVGRGHDVLVVGPSRGLGEGEFRHEGVRVYGARSWPAVVYPSFRICWPLFIESGVKRALARFRPDVIHLQGKFFLGGICYREGKRLGIPMVATNHFMPENFFHYTHLPAAFLQPFKRWSWDIVLEMLSDVDAVTTPTQRAASLLGEVGLKRTVLPISCGVDCGRFKPGRNADALRKRLGVPMKSTVLYTGRLDREKNLDVVFDAMAQVRKVLDAHLIVTGNGSEREKLAAQAMRLGIERHVTFAGYLADDIYPDVHALADCFVQAGDAELQSIVALEAIASGLPLIAADAMALPELVDDGVNGYLFPPGDVSMLAARLVDVLSRSEQQRAMGLASRARALEHDIAHTVSAYEQLYREVCARC